jgi:3-oxoadipate enol-lactonase
MVARQAVSAAGIDIAVERAGHGPHMVWAHGLTSSMDLEPELFAFDWERIRAVADVVRYDARGHGGTTTTPDLVNYGWDRLAADQIALADALDIGSYIAAGASMGTGTALHAAVSWPERVRGLILVIPPTGWDTRAAQRDLYLARADVIESGDIDGVITAARMIPPPDPFGAEWHDRFERNLRAADLARMAHVLRGAATADMPSQAKIAAIEVPTLILAWSGDPGHPLSSAERLAELISGADLHIARSRSDLESWNDRIVALISSVA